MRKSGKRKRKKERKKERVLMGFNRKTRLCMVIPCLQAGGMERVMAEIVTYLSLKKEVEVHLILYGISEKVFFQIPDEVRIHKPSFSFKRGYRLYYTIRTLIYLRREVKKINPLSVLSFGEYWNSFVLLALVGLNNPVFISDRSRPDLSLGRVHDKLRKVLYPKAKGLILQTKKAKEIYYSKKLNNNIRVIGNPIRKISDESQTLKKEKIILMVGRLIKTKHQDKLIEVFAKINSPDWKLVLVGYDHLKQSNMEGLLTLSRELGVSDRVVFAGKQDNVDKYYLQSSIFAFTSSSEGFPNVIGEAMSAGIPVVAFDCIAGPSEMIIDGHNGFLVPLFDLELFQEKLLSLMEDEKLRETLGLNAKETINRFSSDIICESFYSFMTS